MDLNLPQIVGSVATDRLRADPAMRDIPIVALSAHAMAGDRDQALAAGCGDFDAGPSYSLVCSPRLSRPWSPK